MIYLRRIKGNNNKKIIKKYNIDGKHVPPEVINFENTSATKKSHFDKHDREGIC